MGLTEIGMFLCEFLGTGLHTLIICCFSRVVLCLIMCFCKFVNLQIVVILYVA